MTVVEGDDVPASRWATAAVLLCWSLLAVGNSIKAGYYTGPGLVCDLVGFAVLIAVVLVRAPLVRPDRTLLALPLLVCVGAAAVGVTRRYLYLSGSELFTVRALTVATALAALASLAAGGRWRLPAALGVLGLAAATGVVTIVLVSNPGIDVWEILQQSSTRLLHGNDMYRQHWSDSTGLQAVYPYLPGSTLLVAPFRWALGDVRFGMLVASLAAAWIVWRCRPVESPALAALLVVVPGWALFIARSWTEPLLIAALAGMVAALRSGRTRWAVVALAVALACKQHMVLLVPLFIAWPALGWRRTAAAAGLALVVVMPWLVAGPHDLWHDAVQANLALGVQTRALNVPSLLLRHGTRVGFWLPGLVLLTTYAVVLWRLPRTLPNLALGCAAVLWAFDLSNKQTFFNHYMLPLGLLVVALAVADRTTQRQSADRSDLGLVVGL